MNGVTFALGCSSAADPRPSHDGTTAAPIAAAAAPFKKSRRVTRIALPSTRVLPQHLSTAPLFPSTSCPSHLRPFPIPGRPFLILHFPFCLLLARLSPPCCVRPSGCFPYCSSSSPGRPSAPRGSPRPCAS